LQAVQAAAEEEVELLVHLTVPATEVEEEVVLVVTEEVVEVVKRIMATVVREAMPGVLALILPMVQVLVVQQAAEVVAPVAQVVRLIMAVTGLLLMAQMLQGQTVVQVEMVSMVEEGVAVLKAPSAQLVIAALAQQILIMVP
jgi:hypothetical protein